MLVVGVLNLNDGLYNFLFNKKELHINVLGVKSAPSVLIERYSCGIFTEHFQWFRNRVNDP